MITLEISHLKPSLKPCARARDGLREKRDKEMWDKGMVNDNNILRYASPAALSTAYWYNWTQERKDSSTSSSSVFYYVFTITSYKKIMP
jgi:hypothetical protein